MKFICGFIIAAFLVALSSQATPVKPCLNGKLPKEVRIDGCNKVPCHLIRGKNVTAEWDFVISEDTNHLKPRVRATVMGTTVDYPFPQKDACDTLKGATCPLRKGKEVTYKLSMPVLRVYPKLSMVIEFAFLDDSGNVDVCFKLPAKVTDI